MSLYNNVKKQVGKEMCKITKDKVLTTAQFNDVVITKHDTDTAAMDKTLTDYDDAKHYLGEIGCPICKKDDKIFLGKCLEPDVAAACNIQYRECEKVGAEIIGTFHTHPLGGNVPSESDITCFIGNKEPISCIGGKIGDEDRIACYQPNFMTEMRGFVHTRPFTGYYPKFGEKPDGVIKFWTEEPPPTPDDLLAELSDIEIENIISIYDRSIPQRELDRRVKEFKDELEEGSIPDDFWDMYEIEGYQDEIPIYSLGQQKRRDKMLKNHLKKDYLIYEFGCKNV